MANRMWILGFGIAAATAATVTASAQTPTRPVTLVVPIAAGGGVDTIGRVFAGILADRLKQPWVVENRPGAGGVIGIDSVAKAAPDGRTMLVCWRTVRVPTLLRPRLCEPARGLAPPGARDGTKDTNGLGGSPNNWRGSPISRKACISERTTGCAVLTILPRRVRRWA